METLRIKPDSTERGHVHHYDKRTNRALNKAKLIAGDRVVTTPHLLTAAYGEADIGLQAVMASSLGTPNSLQRTVKAMNLPARQLRASPYHVTYRRALANAHALAANGAVGLSQLAIGALQVDDGYLHALFELLDTDVSALLYRLAPDLVRAG